MYMHLNVKKRVYTVHFLIFYQTALGKGVGAGGGDWRDAGG